MAINGFTGALRIQVIDRFKAGGEYTVVWSKRSKVKLIAEDEGLNLSLDVSNGCFTRPRLGARVKFDKRSLTDLLELRRKHA